MPETNPRTIYAIINYEDDYVQPLILAALKARLPADLLVHIHSLSQLPAADARLLQWRQYESIDLDHADSRPSSSLINSYIIRKALIRKHYLSNTISHWLAKNRSSILKTHVKSSVEFEVDYAEFLDDALVEAFELRESFDRNVELEPKDRQWWILKPGMSDRGQGIRLFSTEDELTAIFEGWEAEMPDSDSDEAETSDADTDAAGTDGIADRDEGNGIMTSQLRHFIAQEYIHPPLLLPLPFESANRKFHIRTYVVAVGALKVYVYKPMLALFAGKEYSPPWSASTSSPSDTSDNEIHDPNADLDGHLTNTCLQSGDRIGSVHACWDLPSPWSQSSSNRQDKFDWQSYVFEQICSITGETFEAAARAMAIHFQPLPNAFEIFGVDFMVDDVGAVWLLEVNAFPDFKQTGSELSGLIQGLFEGVVDVGVAPFFGLDAKGKDENGEDGGDMVKVLDIDLGRR